jgi:hypothetical protein
VSAVTATTQPIDITSSSESEDLVTTDFGSRPLFVTTAACVGVAVLGNGLLWWGTANGQIDKTVFWAPVFAIVTTVTALVSFGGFYAASRRARVAIASSFVVTFFVMMVSSLTITALNDSAQAKLAGQLVGDFRSIVLTVVGFYFGSETLITMVKTVAARKSTDDTMRETLGRIDRDLPVVEPQRSTKE